MVSSGWSSGAIAGPLCGLGSKFLGGLLLGGFGLDWRGLLRGLLGCGLLRLSLFGLLGSEDSFGLGQMVDLVLAGNIRVSGEGETESETGKLVVLQFVHDREQHFLSGLLAVLVVSDEMRGYIVGKVVGVDVDEGAEQHTKLRRGEGGGCAIEDAIE